MNRVPFVDVSENQGRIDWLKMRAAGIEFVIIRAGIGSRLDHRLDEYVTGARAAGVVVLGLYWFVNPKSVAGPEQQAAMAISACQRYGVRMLMLDLEGYVPGEAPPPPLSGSAYMAWLERMVAPIRAASLVLTVYTNASYWNPLYVGVGSSLTECDVIVATYPWYSAAKAPQLVAGYTPDRWEERAFVAAASGPLTPAGFDRWDAWQFSAGFNQQGPVYGASSGDLDLNIADQAAVDRWLANPDPPDPHPIEPASLDEESDMEQFRIIYPEGSKYQIANGTRRDVTDAELFFVLGGVFQRPDGSFADGYGNPIANPDPRKPIAFVADRDHLLALPVYSPPTGQGPKGDPGKDAPIPIRFEPVYG